MVLRVIIDFTNSRQINSNLLYHIKNNISSKTFYFINLLKTRKLPISIFCEILDLIIHVINFYVFFCQTKKYSARSF